MELLEPVFPDGAPGVRVSLGDDSVERLAGEPQLLRPASDLVELGPI